MAERAASASASESRPNNRQRPSGPDPESVPCPTCKAIEWAPCRSPKGKLVAKPHPYRIGAAENRADELARDEAGYRTVLDFEAARDFVRAFDFRLQGYDLSVANAVEILRATMAEGQEALEGEEDANASLRADRDKLQAELDELREAHAALKTERDELRGIARVLAAEAGATKRGPSR